MQNPIETVSKEIIEKLQISSVHLKRLDAQNLPDQTGTASGLLLEIESTRYLLTAAHALKFGKLSLQVKWDADRRQTATIPLNMVPFSDKDVDLAWCSVGSNENPLFQELDMVQLSGKITNSKACKIYEEGDIKEPSQGTLYGFAGGTKPWKEDHSTRIQDVKFHGVVIRICYPIEFIGAGTYGYTFQLSGRHPGDSYIEGCSGAPIVDMHGNVVAIVSKGCEKKSEIYGVPLKRHMNTLKNLF